jgi:hypothetical protein
MRLLLIGLLKTGEKSDDDQEDEPDEKTDK